MIKSATSQQKQNNKHAKSSLTTQSSGNSNAQTNSISKSKATYIQNECCTNANMNDIIWYRMHKAEVTSHISIINDWICLWLDMYVSGC